MPDTQDIQSSLKDALPYLLAGGAGAVAGGLLTRRRRIDDGESRLSHVGRVLGNALGAGGAAAGGTWLMHQGVKNLTDMDQQHPITGDKGNEGPLAKNTKSLLFSPLTAAGAGAATLGLTQGIPHIGSDSKGTEDALTAIVGHLKALTGSPDKITTVAQLKALNPDQLHTQFQRIAHISGSRGLWDAAGLTARSGNLGRAEQVWKNMTSTLGNTTGRRIGRGALGLTAAAIPALVGAFTTDQSE